jgi:hypothetical protein
MLARDNRVVEHYLVIELPANSQAALGDREGMLFTLNGDRNPRHSFYSSLSRNLADNLAR